MSVATFERELWREAKVMLNNPKLKLKEILEWRTADIKPQKGEIVIKLTDAWVAVPEACDKREKRTE